MTLVECLGVYFNLPKITSPLDKSMLSEGHVLRVVDIGDAQYHLLCKLQFLFAFIFYARFLSVRMMQLSH